MKTRPTLFFQIGDLPTEGRLVTGTVTFAELGVEDEELIRFPYPVKFTIMLSPVGGHGVLARGSLAADIVMDCDRCLEPVNVTVTTDDVCHLYEDLEIPVVDLTEDVREDILLSFPQACLCRERCRGLCPSCGTNLNQDACSCRPVESEPEEESPWGALDGLHLEPDGD
ncbi:MAG TPA: DUF177 domain-containing protein [Longimicrobiales bacterium]|nr:DUF177 domain-containing protein [Longimicrobiales bacterium]